MPQPGKPLAVHLPVDEREISRVTLMAVQHSDFMQAARPDILLHAPGFFRGGDETRVRMVNEVTTVRVKFWLPPAAVPNVILKKHEVSRAASWSTGKQITERFARMALDGFAQQSLIYLTREKNRSQFTSETTDRIHRDTIDEYVYARKAPPYTQSRSLSIYTCFACLTTDYRNTRSACEVGEGEQQVGRLRVADVRMGAARRQPTAVAPGRVHVDDRLAEFGGRIGVTGSPQPHRCQHPGWFTSPDAANARLALGQLVQETGRLVVTAEGQAHGSLQPRVGQQRAQPPAEDVRRRRHLEDQQVVDGELVARIGREQRQRRGDRIRRVHDRLRQEPAAEGVPDTMQVLPRRHTQRPSGGPTATVPVQVTEEVREHAGRVPALGHHVGPLPHSGIPAVGRQA